MPVLTKTAVEVFAPTDGGGAPRSILPADAQTWGTELEQSLAGLDVIDSTDALVVLVSGQSNTTLNRIGTWTPPPNLYLWNWSNSAPSTAGSAFVPWPADLITNYAYVGKRLADAYPTRKVYMIVLGVGGLDISHWLSGTSGTDMFNIIDVNVPLALSAIGRTAIDLFFWWQGEQDAAIGNWDYVIDYAVFEARIKAKSYFPTNTPQVLSKVNRETNGAPVGYDAINASLEKIVAGDRLYKKLVDTSPLAFSGDGVHTDLADMPVFGKLAVDALTVGTGAPLRPGRRLNPNGDQTIWSRNTTQNSIGTGGKRYCADQYWAFNRGSNGSVNVARTTHSPGQGQTYARYYAAVTKASGSAGEFGYAYSLPNDILQRYRGQRLTFSALVRRSSTLLTNDLTMKATIFSTETRDGTPVSGRSETFDPSLLVASKFRRFSVTLSIPEDTTGQTVQFEIMANEAGAASMALHISEIQIEPGDIATPYEPRDEGTEQAECDRFFQRHYMVCNGYPTAASQTEAAWAQVNFRQRMRSAAPSISFDAAPSRTNCMGDPANANLSEYGATFRNPAATAGDTTVVWRGYVDFNAEID